VLDAPKASAEPSGGVSPGVGPAVVAVGEGHKARVRVTRA